MSALKDGEENEKKYPLVIVRGLPFPKPFVIPKLIEDVIDYKPSKNDIFIVTYPKCGTTWTQFLVWEIMHKGEAPPSPNQIMFKYFPFLEFRGIDCLQNLPDPRVMKTHLPFNLQPYSPSSKYIYIARNPWDCCVSYYHHHCMDPTMPTISFDDYFKLFIKGEVAWGDFFDHVLSWYEQKDEPNVLFLTYEDMKKDVRNTLLTIAQFLGDCYLESLQDERVMENCLKHTSFEYMKNLGMFFPIRDEGEGTTEEDLSIRTIMEEMKKLGEIDRKNAEEAGNMKEVPFFRKGVVGDWKNHFSQDQIQDFNEYLKRKLNGTKLEGFWKPIENV